MATTVIAQIPKLEEPGLLERSFHIRPGEGAPILLLWAHSFSIGVFIAFFFSVVSAEFLSRFEYRTLPWAYILSGGLGYLILGGFSGLERRVSIGKLLTGNLAFLMLLCGLMAYGLGTRDDSWIRFAGFAFILPALALVDLGFWGLAGRLFDLQQGKRLFGLLGSGEVVSEIIGFLLVPFLVGPLGSTGLLAVAAAGLLVSLLVLRMALRRFADQLGERRKPEDAAPEKMPLSAILGDRYFMLIVGMSVLSVFTLYFVDYSFLTETRGKFQGTAALASFLGYFFGATKLLELLTKTFLAGRLITRLGLAVGLVALPAAVLAFVGLAALSGSVGPLAVMFFPLVLVAKLAEFVLRRSIFEPSLRVLFQPLPEATRLSSQARVDGVAKPAGLLLAGLMLLGLSRLTPSSLPIVYSLVAVLVVWLTVIRPTYHGFQRKLVQALASHPRGAHMPSPLDLLRERFRTAPADECAYSLGVLEAVDPNVLEQLLVELLTSARPELRQEAYLRIARLQLIGLLPEIRDAAGKEVSPWVQATAAQAREVLEALARDGPQGERLAELARSPQAPLRELAAAHLAQGENGDSGRLLFALMRDSSTRVRRRALLAAGQTGRPEFWPEIIEAVSSGRLHKAAAAALMATGEDVLGALESAFKRFDKWPEAKLRILRIYERIGGRQAEAALFEKLRLPNRDLVRQAVHSLGVLGFHAGEGESAIVKGALEEVVERLTWYVASRADLSEDRRCTLVAAALDREIKGEYETLFLLLALIADAPTVKLLRDQIASSSAQDRAYAVEIADQILPPEQKEFLLPLFEQLPPAQLISRLSLHAPQRSLAVRDRLIDIMRRGERTADSWLRAAAIEAWVRRGEETVPDALVANLHSSNVMVCEMAAWALSEVDRTEHERQLAQLPATAALPLSELFRPGAAKDPRGDRNLLVFEKVNVFKSTDLFASIPSSLLARHAARAREKRFSAGATLFRDGEHGQTFYLLIEGRVRVEKDGRVLAHRGELDLIGEIAALQTGVRTATVAVEEPSRMLEMDRDVLFDMIAQNIALLPGIVEVISTRRAAGRVPR